MSDSTEYEVEKENTKSFKGFMTDVKNLTKGKVLFANVFPIIATFWMALFFADVTFIEIWDKFIFMLIGGTLVVAGALFFNNWYVVDLYDKMERTQERYTVTGIMLMFTVLMIWLINSS